MRNGGLIGEGGAVCFFISFQVNFDGEVDGGFGGDGIEGESVFFQVDESVVNAGQSVFDLRFEMGEVFVDRIKIT